MTTTVAKPSFESTSAFSLRGRDSMFWLGVIVVAAQRFGVTFGDFTVPAVSLAVAATTVVMVLRGVWVIGPIRGVIFLFFLAAGMTSLAMSQSAATGASSLIFVALLWLPAIAVSRPGQVHAASPSFAAGVVVATGTAGLLACVQSGLSFATRSVVDPIGLLPQEVLIQGYRSAQPVSFGSSWMKANGFVFLEPSFLSLISALGLVLVLSGYVSIGRGRVVLLVALVAGMTTSVAISGVILLPVLFVMLIATSKRAVSTFLVAAIAIPLITAIPVTKAFTDRLFYMQGSNDARLVRPYTELLPVWADGPIAFGFGPGSARELADAITADNWQTEVTTPTVVKVLFEYGIVGGLVFIALLVVMLGRSSSPISVKVALMVALIVPTDGLTNHVIVPCVALVLLTPAARDRLLTSTPPPLPGALQKTRTLETARS